MLVQVFVCFPDVGQSVGDNVDVQSLSVQGGVYVQVCEVTGVPPAQPEGYDGVAVLVRVPV